MPFASREAHEVARLERERVAERLERLRVERLRGLLVADVDGGVVDHLPSLSSLQSPRMILDNGVVRTMDPALPVARALAIAGERVAGGVGTHETVLPTPEVVDLRGRCVVPGFTDSHVHFPTWALGQRDLGLDGVTSLAEALDRVRGAAPTGRLDPRAGLALRGLGGRADEGGAGRGHGRDAGGAVGEGPPLAVAELGGARARGRRPRGRGRGRRAQRARRPDRRPPRGGGLALPRALPVRLRRRVARGHAGGRQARAQPRRHRGARQGRLDRRARDLPAAPAAGGAHAPRLAVAPVEEAPGARGARASAPASATTSSGSAT